VYLYTIPWVWNNIQYPRLFPHSFFSRSGHTPHNRSGFFTIFSSSGPLSHPAWWISEIHVHFPRATPFLRRRRRTRPHPSANRCCLVPHPPPPATPSPLPTSPPPSEPRPLVTSSPHHRPQTYSHLTNKTPRVDPARRQSPGGCFTLPDPASSLHQLFLLWPGAPAPLGGGTMAIGWRRGVVAAPRLWWRPELPRS
jgi:hypothetical protein